MVNRFTYSSKKSISDKLNENYNNAYSVILFLIWPFGAFILAMRNYRMPYAKNLVWFFTIYFGFTFVISNQEMDATRYITEFYNWRNYPFSLEGFFRFILSEESGKADIFIPLVSFIVFNLTESSKVYLAVLGMIYGFLYSRSIWYIIDRITIKAKIPFFIGVFIILFALLFPIWRGVNGPRFAIAANIFFLGTIRYLIEGKKKGLLIASLSIFVHFSCAFSVILLWLYYFLKNRYNLYFAFFIVTLFIRQIDFELVRNTLNFLPAVYNEKVKSYASMEYAEESILASTGLNWYVYLYIQALNWTMVAIILSLYIKGRYYIRNNSPLLNLFSFSLLLLAFSNLAALVPSGDRFLTLSYMFILAIYCWYLNHMPRQQITKWLNIISSPGILLYMIVQLRIGFDTLGLLTVFGNPVISLLFEGEIALIEYLK